MYIYGVIIVALFLRFDCCSFAPRDMWEVEGSGKPETMVRPRLPILPGSTCRKDVPPAGHGFSARAIGAGWNGGAKKKSTRLIFDKNRNGEKFMANFSGLIACPKLFRGRIGNRRTMLEKATIEFNLQAYPHLRKACWTSKHASRKSLPGRLTSSQHTSLNQNRF